MSAVIADSRRARIAFTLTLALKKAVHRVKHAPPGLHTPFHHPSAHPTVLPNAIAHTYAIQSHKPASHPPCLELAAAAAAAVLWCHPCCCAAPLTCSWNCVLESMTKRESLVDAKPSTGMDSAAVRAREGTRMTVSDSCRPGGGMSESLGEERRRRRTRRWGRQRCHCQGYTRSERKRGSRSKNKGWGGRMV